MPYNPIMAAIDPTARYGLVLVILTIVVGLAGMWLLWYLMVAWRHSARRRAQVKARRGSTSDLWQASGDRLVGKINQLIYEDRPLRPQNEQEDDYDAHTDDFDDFYDSDDSDDDPRDDDDPDEQL